VHRKETAVTLVTIAKALGREVSSMRFGPPVTHVYNPLDYAWAAHETYLRRFGTGRKEIVLVGMNPGPWGMAQTGVPFGEVTLVREWMGIDAAVGVPEKTHPKKPVTGFSCSRSEVSGKRLWGWARRTFETPERFFARFFVVNYCPLLFLDAEGRNRTPDKLAAGENKALFGACDHALRETVRLLAPAYVIGVGTFAGQRILHAMGGGGFRTGAVSHPSPANPRANRGWATLVEQELRSLGIEIDGHP